ncbi:MAG TPA: N-acetylmuramoyl-L-alanine amidase [Candidatus Acidoferrales bacterium]
MRKPLFLYIFFCVAFAVTIGAPLELPVSWAQTESAPPPPPPQAPVSPSLPPIIATPQNTPTEPPLTIVLDAAHGGTDNGARGSNGISEKDVVLALVRGCRAELTTRGYRVVMTRDSDADPTFDDRAALANQFADAIFVSLHVASTGTPSTVRVYYDRIASAYTMTTLPPGATPGTVPPPTRPVMPAEPISELISWRKAQVSFDDASHRFADMVQAGLAQKFSGSPTNSIPAAVRDLRSVAAPAVDIEISNINSPNVATLESMSPSIASALAQAIAQFHATGAAH